MRWATIPSSTVARGVSPDTPGIWQDISNVWPSSTGGYSVVDVYSNVLSPTATGETAGSQKYAFAAVTPSGSVCWVVGTKIWAFGTPLVDKTNGVTVGTSPHMTQFGNITICAMGNGNSTVASTSGGNFSAVAAAPKAEIVVTCSNAVLAFNTDTSPDGWAASDVGDYTNWTTGDAASGRLIQTPGPILAAVAFGNVVYVFKQASIYRGTYVGGTVKWSWEVVCRHMGSGSYSSVSGTVKYSAVACKNVIAFISSYGTDTTSAVGMNVAVFDGASPPVVINPENYIANFSSNPTLTYDPVLDMLCVQGSGASDVQHFYHFPTQRWGKGVATGRTYAVIQGHGTELDAALSNTPGVASACRPYWNATTDTMKLYIAREATNAAATWTSYLETGLVGSADKKTNFKRATPRFNRRANRGSGSPLATLNVTTYNELHGGTSNALSTVSESSSRARFDFTATDCFAKFRLTLTDIVADIDGIALTTTPAGAE